MANDIANLLANAAQTNANWKGLGDIGEALKQGRIDEMRQQALQQYAAGDPSALLRGGDLQLANLYMLDKARTTGDVRDLRDFQFRQQEATRSQSNADRTFGLSERRQTQAEDKVPEGFRAKPDDPNSQEFIPGGPKDPAYIRDTAKPRQMSFGDINKLVEEGSKLSELRGFLDTFKPEYAGHTLTGPLPNVAGRILPEAVVGSNIAQGAAWWQNYDKHRNVVRHELFGSALTPGEKAAFEQSDVNPRMDPAQIKRNLAVQRGITERGISRKAEAYIQQGADPEVVSKSLGLKFQGRAPSSGPSASTAPQPQLSSNDAAAADWAARNPNDPRAAAIKQRLGIQ